MILGFGFLAQRGDARRHDVVKAVFIVAQRHIALRLHGKAGDAVARDLRQQAAGHALYAEGERGVLECGIVTHLGQAA